MSRLTDRQAIRLALLLAIDTEEASIDAHEIGYIDDDGNYVRDAVPPEDRELVERLRHNIDAFTRVLGRYYGARPEPLAFLKNKLPDEPERP